MYQKRDKKGQKEPNLCFEASRGFVYWLRFCFEFKTREEYHKLLSDNIFIDIWLIWGALCIKNGPKRVKKSQICVSRLLEALFVVKEKYSEVITDEGHYNDEFDTHYIYIWWIESVVFNENKVKKHQKGPNWWFETLFSVYRTPYFHKISMK